MTVANCTGIRKIEHHMSAIDGDPIDLLARRLNQGSRRPT
jgi:hypothetical protein